MRRAGRLAAIWFCSVIVAGFVSGSPEPGSAQGLLGGTAGPTQATGAGQPLREIVIDGAQRIDPVTVRSYLTVDIGDRLDQRALDDSLKSLFRSGLFTDVVLRQDGGRLIVSVVENPIINRIAFEGNSAIDDETLDAEVELRPRVVYTRTRVQNDVARLAEVYRRSGRFAASIEPKVIQLEQNRVDLVFEIDEGARTKVRRIDFVGNRAFSDGRLREEIATREARFWRVLSASDSYDPDRLSFDRELLRRFYLSQGYADFRVVSAVAELTPDREEFFITFTVDEGDQYRFGDIAVVSRLPNLDASALEDAVVSDETEVYSAEAVEETIEALTRSVEEAGVPFVDVRPRVTRDRGARLINVTYEVNEGRRLFVDRIDIAGNTRTVDRVIRRELELVEGDPFNAARLRQSERQLRNLGFFERVEISQVPGSAPDQTVVQVGVTEQPTGEISLGAGFSTTQGPLGNFSITERNLLGRGQRLSFGATVSGNVQEFEVSFTEPYFLGRDLSAGFDVFRTTRSNQRETSFDLFEAGAGLRLGYPLSDRLRQTWRYELALREVRDVDDDASLVVQSQEGETVTSAIETALIYDQLDSRIRPTDGYFLRGSLEFAGLGGDVRLLRASGRASFFTPLFSDEYILNLNAEAGQVVGLAQDVRIADRFFVGGNNFRGFAPSGVGPRDDVSDDSLGGNTFALGTAEVSFPTFLPEELGFRARVFTDVGTLTNTDDEEQSGLIILDDPSLRASVGVGLSWSSPLGPIQLDFAVPVLKEDYDKEEEFRFSFGTRF